MKKKIILALTAAALTTLMIVGGTLAWFTDKEEANNVISLGNVDVTLTEPGFNRDTAINIVPGDVITKDPTIKNEGEATYIRANIDYTGSTIDVSKIDEVSLLGINTNVWSKVGDYYYYVGTNGFLDKGANSIKLFEKVTIPTSWDNTFAKKELHIKVKVEALQYKNNVVTFDASDSAAQKAAKIAAKYVGVTIQKN